MSTGALQARTLVELLREHGHGPFTGVPCSFLGPVISCLEAEHPQEYVIAANEGEAVALAAGAVLAGRRPVVILQNSGLGNTVNPLTSLCHTLRLPVLLLVTWRGRPGRPDEPQHELMGRITQDMLTSMGVRNEVLPDDPALLAERLDVAAGHMDTTGLPFAFIVPKGAVAPYEAAAAAPTPAAGPPLMKRAEAIGHIVSAMDPDTLLVATTGKTARELERDWDRPQNLYVVGSMGCASSVALGVALNTPDRRVAVLDGDGAALMRLEAMATIGRHSGTDLCHLLLDNESYESTGGQPTASAGVDFAGIAAACGYRSTHDVRDADALRAAVLRAQQDGGAHLVRVRIAPGSDPNLGRPALAPPASAARFKEAIAR
ncbi:phosphonopyruvate decarboxylase [Streptomyces virginiae]|uniref:phosphonopyruvate decarboxylase n=1 Tax=Streptomyces TaxID=1883 RepID=UPI0003C9DBBA|nr:MULTISPECIES: phosphonopyruvate decarboxylase [unclassified Streptomyces]AGZ93860.1 phosphonopyruvate decarboxylase [Streptomyces sp. WM6373]